MARLATPEEMEITLRLIKEGVVSQFVESARGENNDGREAGKDKSQKS